MSKRYGHQSLITIAPEAAYGTVIKQPTEKYSGMWNWDQGYQPVPTNFKTQTLEPKVCTQQAGRIAPTGTMTLDYVEELDTIIKKLIMDASTAHTIPTSDDGTVRSFTICRAFPTPGVVNDGGDGFRGTGWLPTKLTVTRDGDKIVSTIDWIGQDGDEEVDFAGSEMVLSTITNTSPPCHTLCFFHALTCSLLDGGTTKLNNFTLTIEALYNDEDSQFQNGQTRTNPRVIGFNIGLDAEFIYDTTNDALAYDNIFSQTAKTVVLTITDGTAVHAYTLYGQYVKWNLPDIDRGEYLGNFTFEARGDGSNTALSLAIS